MFAFCYIAVEYYCIVIPIHKGVLDKLVHDPALFGDCYLAQYKFNYLLGVKHTKGPKDSIDIEDTYQL